jgi:hypothetical protein
LTSQPAHDNNSNAISVGKHCTLAPFVLPVL